MNEQDQNEFSYKRKAILLIIAFAVIRTVLAFTMALGVDESYYWTYSQYLKWNYFDHPPLVAYLIRLTTFNLSLESVEGFVRLGSVLGCAASTWFIYKTCELLHTAKAGFYAACLYNASFYASITAGIFIMPDSPQMVFYTLCLWLIARISFDEKNWLNWILFGAAAGLCIMSKVHGVFIWFGFGLYILFKKRNWLTDARLYVAVIISLVISSPILIWNIQNDFVAYKFHSERVDVGDVPFNTLSFLGELVSQFIYNNPFTVAITCVALAAYARNKQVRTRPLSIFNFIGLPLALMLIAVSFFKDTTLPHWSGPAYVALIPLAAIHLTNFSGPSSSILFRSSIISFVLVLAGWAAAHHFYPGTFGEKLPQIAANDSMLSSKKFLSIFNGFEKMQLVTEPLEGWDEAVNKFDSVYKKDFGIMGGNSPVVSNDWRGAQTDYYFCNKRGREMIGLGNINDLHEYLWMNEKRRGKVNFANAYYVVSSEFRNEKHSFQPYYNTIDSLTTITVDRTFRPPLQFHIYRLSGWKNNLPVPN